MFLVSVSYSIRKYCNAITVEKLVVWKTSVLTNYITRWNSLKQNVTHTPSSRTRDLLQRPAPLNCKRAPSVSGDIKVNCFDAIIAFYLANEKSEMHWYLANSEAPAVLLEVCHALQQCSYFQKFIWNSSKRLWPSHPFHFMFCFYNCNFAALMFPVPNCTESFNQLETVNSSNSCVWFQLKLLVY